MEKGKVCNKDLDKQQSEEIEVDKLDHDVLWKQLFSSNLMRLWRTGACELLYKSKEDDEVFVSCEMYTGIDITYGTVSAKIAPRLTCYKNASRLNRYIFPTDNAIHFLFSTRHTTPFHYEVLKIGSR